MVRSFSLLDVVLSVAHSGEETCFLAYSFGENILYSYDSFYFAYKTHCNTGTLLCIPCRSLKYLIRVFLTWPAIYDPPLPSSHQYHGSHDRLWAHEYRSCVLRLGSAMIYLVCAKLSTLGQSREWGAFWFELDGPGRAGSQARHQRRPHSCPPP